VERRLQLNADELATLDLDPLEHLGIQEALDVGVSTHIA